MLWSKLLLLLALLTVLVVLVLAEEDEEEESTVSTRNVPQVPAFLVQTNWQEIVQALQDASSSSVESLRKWAIALLLLSRPLMQTLLVILEALLPHFQNLVWAMWLYLRKQRPLVLVQLASALLLLLVALRKGYFTLAKNSCLSCERSVRTQYQSATRSLRRKSKTVALLLPHLLFCLLGLALLLSPLPTALWANDTLLSIVLTWIPVFRSAKLLFHQHASRQPAVAAAITTTTPRGRPSTRRRTAAPAVSTNLGCTLETCCMYWILWACVTCVGGILSLFVTQSMTDYLFVPYGPVIWILVWMQLPWTDGTRAVYGWISPWIHPYANRIAEPRSTDRANIVLRTLSFVNFVTPKNVNIVSDLLAQGPALFGCIFLFTPGFITYRGALLVGMAFPAYIAIGTLVTVEQRRLDWWVTYFTVLACVEYVIHAVGTVFAWVPFFYHGKLLLIFWLQFPYFRGAARLFDLFMKIFVPLKDKRD